MSVYGPELVIPAAAPAVAPSVASSTASDDLRERLLAEVQTLNANFLIAFGEGKSMIETRDPDGPQMNE